MQISIRILGTPRWANGGRNARFVPANPSDYADFAVATAKRYPSVRLWSVWGEPNRESMFGPLTPSPVKGPLNAAQQVAPRNYAILLDTTYGALKALNPANLIIGGNTFNSTGTRLIHPYQWIRYLTLPHGSRPRMDLYGHNPFCYRKPTLKAPPSPMGRVDFSDLPRFGKAIDRYFPGPRLRFFLAEWGVDVGTEVEGRFRVKFKTQAKWIRAGYRIARTWDRIYTLGWVRAIDTDISTGGADGPIRQPQARLLRIQGRLVGRPGTSCLKRRDPGAAGQGRREPEWQRHFGDRGRRSGGDLGPPFRVRRFGTAH